MNTFKLLVLSPNRAFYIGDCVSLVVPLEDGLFGIMAGHSALTAAIVPGEVTFTKPDGERVVCAVSQGMVDVSPGEDVKILCESVLRPDEIDAEQEEKDAAMAREAARNRQSYKDYRLSQLLLAKALNNLRVKRRDRELQEKLTDKNNPFGL